MKTEDELKILIGGYFGIQEMDEYDLKVYILKDIEDSIHQFIKTHLDIEMDYQTEINKIEKLPLKNKLQDALLVLQKINGPLDLKLLVKAKIKELNSEKN